MSEDLIASAQPLVGSFELSQRFPQGGQAMADEPLRRIVLIRNPQGFHVRPAAALAQRARKFQSQVTLINGDIRVDGRDAMALLMLCAEQGTEITLEVQGHDAEEAIEVLANILGAEGTPDLTITPPPPKEG